MQTDPHIEIVRRALGCQANFPMKLGDPGVIRLANIEPPNSVRVRFAHSHHTFGESSCTANHDHDVSAVAPVPDRPEVNACWLWAQITSA
jgi:hypothetical protein